MSIVELGSFLLSNRGLTKKSRVDQFTSGHFGKFVKVKTISDVSEISVDSVLGILIMSVNDSIEVRV